MKPENIKDLLDACFVAKKITETMADLPVGMKPRHIHVIDAVHELEQQEKNVRVSDVSKKLNITAPSVTKLIKELLEMGLITKTGDSHDKRSITLQLTEKGRQYEKQYVTDYHYSWAINASEITEAQAEAAITVIHTLYEAMPKAGDHDE